MKDQIPQMQLVEAKPMEFQQEPSVALMLQKVIEGGITADNVSALEALVGLYDRMQNKKSEQEFNAAFSEMQSRVKRIQAIHPVPAKDGTIKYHVAKFQEVWNEVEPALLENGFTASFAQKHEEGLPIRVTTTFILRHTASGFKTETPFTVRVGNGPPGCVDYQADGAASSYAKMRSMCSALNIIIESGDDDARMIGKPIGKAIAEDLLNRVKLTGSDMISFLKYAGVKMDTVEKSIGEYDPLEFFMQISDDRYPSLDELLKRKEAKL